MFMRFMSDLHLEFEPRKKGTTEHFTPFTIPVLETDADTVLVLAGDIAVAKNTPDYKYFIDNVAERFKHVIWIMGNHEHYKGSVHRSIAKITRAVKHDNLSVVENEIITIGDVDFICATLWTDFANANPIAMMKAQMLPMNDYKKIRTYAGPEPGGIKGNPYVRKILPADTVGWHRTSLRFIVDALTDSTARKKVVVTHHGPSHQSIGPDFKGDELNAAYVSPLDVMIESLEPDYWIHGHLHNTSDYNIGHTNVLSNPRGYCTEEYNLQFDPEWTIDLS